jgi:hypothetical protein
MSGRGIESASSGNILGAYIMSDRGIKSLESLHHDGCVAFGSWPLVRGLEATTVKSSGGLGDMKSHPRKNAEAHSYMGK